MGAPRRISPRLQNIPEEKRPYYGPDGKRTHGKEDDSVVITKKPRLNISKKPCLPNISRKKSRIKDKGDETDLVSDVNPNAGGETRIVDAKDEEKWPIISTSRMDEQGINYSKRVKETLRIFNGHYLHFVKIEEERSKEAKNRAGDDNVKKPSKRPDLKAMKKARC
ncbi:hypothetical protein L484_013143 [Morus notabilis]|uniref:Uncharacterized protein n=1 Tax=Morus notabilis TaxID=981085 RepID=W9RM59_9ROSA|nr:hypothetical protein L484_013143 [Morus notabilis]